MMNKESIKGRDVTPLMPLSGTSEGVEVARETAGVWGYLRSGFFMLSLVSLA